MDDQQGAKAGHGRDMSLADYYPYRLAVLSHEISRSFTPLYQNRFGLSRQEWRVLAALGEHSDMSAREISAYSTLEKMQTSRAVAGLLDSGLIGRVPHARDRREKRIRLTARGRRVYRELVPLALARESALLEALSPEERALLDQVIDRLVTRARALREQDGGP
jgi:DNA-binding MarR family transcriptional regulator